MSAGMCYQLGPFRLDPGRRRLETMDGTERPLTARAFDALVCLTEHAGEVVDRRTLMATLWPDSVVEENNLNQAIVSLRRAVGKDAIATVPGRGYQLVLPVRGITAAEPPEAAAAAVSLHRAGRAGAAARVLAVAAAGVTLLGALTVLLPGEDSCAESEQGCSENRAAPALTAPPASATPPCSPDAWAPFLAVPAASPPERIELLDRALELDPDCAPAHAAKAFLLSQGLVNTAFGTALGLSADELDAAIRRHAEQAIALDPALPDARVALGNLYLFTWRWTEARNAFEHAAAATPNAAELVHYAYLDAYTGSYDDALHRIEALIPLNPDVPVLVSIRGLIQAMAGNLDAAAASLRSGPSVSSLPFNEGQLQSMAIERGWLAAVEVARGNTEAALSELRLIEQIRVETRDAQLPLVAHAYARLGLHAEARRVFDEIERAADSGARLGAGAWAQAYLAIGDDARALEWLETAARKAGAHEPDENFWALMHLRMNLLSDPTLERPEFAEALSRITGD